MLSAIKTARPGWQHSNCIALLSSAGLSAFHRHIWYRVILCWFGSQGSSQTDAKINWLSQKQS